MQPLCAHTTKPKFRLMSHLTTQNPYDEEWRQIFLKVKTELTTHLAPGETLPDDLEQETWEIHNELNSMAQQKAAACIDRFRQLLHGVIGPVTPDHLTELMNEEIALFLPSGFLQPDYCHTTCKERVRARQELSELPVDTDELNVARYALLRKLVENKNGSLLIDKARGICYVYNKWDDLTPKAKRDFVRFGYMLRLINDKLTELENNRVEEAVSEKPEEVQPEPSPTDVFLAKVKQIMLLAEAGNGQQKELTARGNGGSYIYKVDGKQFCQVLDELQANHLPLISSYLSGAKGEAAGGIKYVAPFIGFVLDTHLFSSPLMPKNALREVFELVYGKGTSALKKMGNSLLSDEAETLYNKTLDIMKNHPFR